MTTAAGFRQLFRRYPAGVVVITLDAGAGPVGFTATSLASVSAAPPLISFGISTGSSSWPHLRAATDVVVNFLAAQQESLARRFATSGIDRFDATNWSRVAGVPVLDGTAGWLRARVRELLPTGDHHLVLAEVEDDHLAGAPSALIYHDGGYRAVG